MRKFLSLPFVLIGLPVFGMGLLIRYGLAQTIEILDDMIPIFEKASGV